MFRTFARILSTDGAEKLGQFHPSDLTALLELAWDYRFYGNEKAGHPFRRSNVAGFGATWFGRKAFTPPERPDPTLPPTDLERIITAIKGAGCGVGWDHLIYAYMIENTRIYDIFRRVIYEFLHGEKLGVPSTIQSQNWLRTTEELFYRAPPPFFITAVTSDVRQDINATRRNAYQRMFGMDLNHGTEENKPYPYVKAEAANNEFVSTFEEFLREVWLARENVNNTSGANPKDDAKIADLAEKLYDMLLTRRQTGNLSREEFVFVSMLSWFHLTVDNNLPIIQDLRALATSPEQRLFIIAQRVGLPAHGLSKSYFDIADSISRILILIETGILNNPDAVPVLYTPIGGDGPEVDITTIIRHWSIITGREMKARKVTPS